MSWAFQFAAKTKDVAKAQINTAAAQPNGLPPHFGEVLKEQIDALPEPSANTVILVESNGHVDHSTGYGYQNGDMKSRITLIPLLALLVTLFFPALGRAADVPAPRFGASWGTVTIGPRVAAPAMSVDLKTGDVQFNVIPGLGYSVEQTGGKVPWGFGVYASIRDTANGNRLCPAAAVDVFEYLHAGVLWQPGYRGGRAYGLLALGTDLGVTPPAVQNAKPAQ